MTDFQMMNAFRPQETSQPKTRNCLRCSNEFESEWAGERICSRCKSSTAWQSGMPVVTRPKDRGR